MSQHAPGPWRAVFKGGIGYFNVNMDTPPHLTVVTHVRECDANLIAAAPDMFDALEYIANAELSGRHCQEVAKAALKKARGEE